MDLLADLAPDIADLEGPAGVEVFCEGLAAAGVPALRAGLSAAAWDLAGQQAGEPVWRMLGLARPSVRTSYTIAIGAPEEMLAQARAASAFGTLKVKLGFDGDLDLARRLKVELPDVTFRYDANEGWDRERAASALAVLEDLDAELVEQPLPAADTEGMAWLKERTRIPLLADEAVLTIDDLDAVSDAYDGVVVKLSKAGGIAARLRPHLGVHRARPARPHRLHGRVEPGHRRGAPARGAGRLRRPRRGLAAGRGPVHGHHRWTATCSPRRRRRGWGCGRPADVRVASRLTGGGHVVSRPDPGRYRLWHRGAESGTAAGATPERVIAAAPHYRGGCATHHP